MKYVAFIAEEYSEFDFSSGGIKLNFEILNKLRSLGFKVDVYSKKYEKIQNLMNNYYNFDEAKNIKSYEKYDIILSEKGICDSDITYIHDHSYKYRIDNIKSGFAYIIYRIFSNKSHIKRYKKDLEIKENLKKISNIIVSSQVLKQDIIRNFNISENKITIIPPPILNLECNKETTKNNIPILGCSAIGFVRKGGYILLKSIRNLKKEKLKFKVKIIYNDYNKNFLIKLLIKIYGIENFIEFLPQQSDMDKFYKQIDFAILPSLVEPFGMIGTEAMAHFKPVIASSKCGICDFIDDNKNGFIANFERNKAENLSIAMKKAITLKKSEYTIIAQNARNSVKNLYIDNFIKEYFYLFTKKERT